MFVDSAKFEVGWTGDVFTAEAIAEERADVQRQARQRARQVARSKELMVGKAAVGEVVRVEGYGLFVDVGGVSPGLVHISKVSEAPWEGKAKESKVSGWGAYCCDFLSLPITSGCS